MPNIANNNPGTPPIWIKFTPIYDSQYSATTHTDAEDCVEESLCHIMYCLTGRRYSPRALAMLTQVNPTGSTCDEAIIAANKYGLVPYELWPTPDTFTWESYYADIPKDVLDRADKYVITLVAPDLNVSPIWAQLNFLNGTKHLVCKVSDTEYFDSEQGAAIKPLNYEGAVTTWQSSIACTIDHFATETSDPVTVNTPIIP